jgi:hypothetical protein
VDEPPWRAHFFTLAKRDEVQSRNRPLPRAPEGGANGIGRDADW